MGDMMAKAAAAHARFAEKAKAVEGKSVAVAPAKPVTRDKDARNPRKFSFYKAGMALDVHHTLRDLRNESYIAAVLAALSFLGAIFLFYHGIYILALPLGIYAGWNWAWHKDKMEKFVKRGKRPVLTPDIMGLYDNSKPIPFEGLAKTLDFKPIGRSIFKF